MAPLPTKLPHRQHRLSRFELLPTEVRWQVYEQLGYPVATYREFTCKYPDECTYTKDKIFEYVQVEDGVEKTTLKHFVRIERYDFRDYEETLHEICPLCTDELEPILCGVSLPFNLFYSGSLTYLIQGRHDTEPFESSLLRVNKFIQADVSHLLARRGGPIFGFPFELSM